MTSTLGGAEVVHQTLIANWGLHEFSTMDLIEMQTRGGRCPKIRKMCIHYLSKATDEIICPSL